MKFEEQVNTAFERGDINEVRAVIDTLLTAFENLIHDDDIRNADITLSLQIDTKTILGTIGAISEALKSCLSPEDRRFHDCVKLLAEWLDMITHCFDVANAAVGAQFDELPVNLDEPVTTGESR